MLYFSFLGSFCGFPKQILLNQENSGKEKRAAGEFHFVCMFPSFVKLPSPGEREREKERERERSIDME